MGLPIRDILLLDYLDGKPLHTKVPSYQEKVLGGNTNQRLQLLLEAGWIRQTKPQETVNMLPDQALADFLAHHGYDSKGSHVELVRRVIENIPENAYEYAVPKLYIATARGKREMTGHMAYILNARGNYGLTEGEIGEAQRILVSRGASCSAKNILLRAFLQKVDILNMSGEWTRLRNLYFTMANFYVRDENARQALTMLYLVFLLDMSGMGNRNHLVSYEELFPTQKGIILLMDQLRRTLQLSDSELKGDFLSSIARYGPRLPFSYFSPQIIFKILMERLQGNDFDRTGYIVHANTPDPDSRAYHFQVSHFTPLTFKEKQKELERQKPLQLKRNIQPTVPPVMRISSVSTAPFTSGKISSRGKKEVKKKVYSPKVKKKSWLERLLGK